MARESDALEHIDYCPWCGDELQGENMDITDGDRGAIRDCPNHGKLSIEVWPFD